MLVDGPLLAPCSFHLPPNVDPAKMFQWLHGLEVPLTCEIFTLSSRSILYEMAQHCLQRPWHRSATQGDGVAALTQHFSETLRRFEHCVLLTECRMLFMNHLEAGLSCIRFQPALERLLPVDGAELLDTNPAGHPASRSSSALISEGSVEHCVAEEVALQRWVFRDVDDLGPQRLSRQGSCNTNDGSCVAGTAQRLRLGADAKLAYSVTLFVWAAVRLLARRIELLQEFPADHMLFAPSRALEVPKVSSLGNSFETLHFQRDEVARRGLMMYYQHDWQGALEEFTHALGMTLDEGQYFLLQYRAACHHHLQQHRQAVADCTSAIHCNPHAYVALYRRAQAHEALGDLQSAMDDVAQLLRLYPASSQGRQFHARLVASAIPSPHPYSNPKEQAVSVEEEGNRDSVQCVAPHPIESPRTPCSASPLGSPLSPISSTVGPTFVRTYPHIDLAALPPHSEPPTMDDAPYMSSFIESGVPLEYVVCRGKELGRGASGCVYKGVHPSGGWFMAVKEMEAKYIEEDTDLLDALELLATMRHNQILRCLGMRRLPGLYHVVLQYCSGGTLRSLIGELGGLPPLLMRKYATEVLRALRYVHSHGLIHRDIKASNIFLLDDGTSKIGDFGTCMRIPEGEQKRCASVRGTVLWMAPETFRARYSPASDIWSFGCTLIEMATGKDPWHEQHFHEQITAMVFIATRPDALPTIPPQLGNDDFGRDFFHRCIARDPSERCSADLLLRHPWLTNSESSSITSPGHPPPCIQECRQEKLADARFRWRTSSGASDSAFMETKSNFAESLTVQ